MAGTGLSSDRQFVLGSYPVKTKKVQLGQRMDAPLNGSAIMLSPTPIKEKSASRERGPTTDKTNRIVAPMWLKCGKPAVLAL